MGCHPGQASKGFPFWAHLLKEPAMMVEPTLMIPYPVYLMMQRLIKASRCEPFKRILKALESSYSL